MALIGILLIGWGLGGIAESVTQRADLDLVRDAAGERTGLLTVIAHGSSLLGSGYVIFPLTLACCAVCYRLGRRSHALAIALSASGGVLIANVDKFLVGRPRPTVHHLEMVRSSSFPSGHATQATAFYLSLLIALRLGKAPRVVALTAAVAVGVLILGIAFSRVYLGVHYPSDVVAGVLLGGAWALLVAVLLRRPGAARSIWESGNEAA